MKAWQPIVALAVFLGGAVLLLAAAPVYRYDADTAARDAVKAFRQLIDEKCAGDDWDRIGNHLRIVVEEVTQYSAGRYQVNASIYLDDKDMGSAFAFVDDTLGFPGFHLNGTDIIGNGIRCQPLASSLSLGEEGRGEGAFTELQGTTT